MKKFRIGFVFWLMSLTLIGVGFSSWVTGSGGTIKENITTEIGEIESIGKYLTIQNENITPVYYSGGGFLTYNGSTYSKSSYGYLTVPLTFGNKEDNSYVYKMMPTLSFVYPSNSANISTYRSTNFSSFVQKIDVAYGTSSTASVATKTSSSSTIVTYSYSFDAYYASATLTFVLQNFSANLLTFLEDSDTSFAISISLEVI